MRSIKLKMCTMRNALILLCLVLTLGGCGPAGGRGSLEAGARYQAEGNYRAAYIEAKKVLQQDEKNGAAWLLLGKASLMLGKPKDALNDLQKARSHGVPKADWVVPLGQLFQATQQYDTLLQEVSTDGLADSTAKGQVYVLRGDAHRQLKQLDDATQAYRAALALNAKDADALTGLARIAAGRGDTVSANDYMQKAEAAAPQSARVWLAKADLAFERHDFAGAEASYQKALDFKHPGWTPEVRFYALTRLASTQAQQRQFSKAMDTVATLEKTWPNEPYPHYLHAVVLYNQGHLEEATSQLQKVLRAQPDSVQAQLLMGAINYGQNNYAQAEMYLSNVMGMDPNNVQARKLLALTMYREGRSQQALSTLRPAAPGQPSDSALLALLQKAAAEGITPAQTEVPTAPARSAADTRLARAQRAIASGQAEQAVRILEGKPENDDASEASRNTLLVMAYLSEKHTDKAVKTAAAYATKHPDQGGAHLLYGTSLVAAGKRGEARAQFLQAHKLDPNNPRALLSLGNLDAIEGHYKKASERYESVLKQHPDNADALDALGRLALLKNDKPKAIERFKKAIAAAPKSPSAYLGLMLLYGESGQFDEAGDIARQFAKAAPDNPAALNALGVTELTEGHYDKALEPLRKAVQLAPGTPVYRINLARAQILGKNTPQAKQNLLEVLKAHPEQITATTLLANLKSQEDDLPGAIALARKLQKNSATRAAGFGLEGDLYMANKAWAKAAHAYQQGLKDDYSRAFVIKRFLALSKSGAGDPAGVLHDWLAKHPDDASARLMLGEHYLGRADTAKAADQYRRILKDYPSNVAALNNLAWIYTTQRNPEALKLAAKAYKLAPRSAGVADTYGWALIAANRPERALPILTKAAKENAKVPSIRYHLAVAQARTGDKAAALATLKALQASGAEYPEKAAAEKLYRDINGDATGNASR